MIPANINSLLLSADAAAPTGYQISRSLRFNGSVDSSYLSRTPASAGNRKTWTFSCWVKRSSLGVQQDIFTAGPRSSSGNATGLVYLEFETTNQLILIAWTGSSSNVKIQTTALFRDTAAWYHIVAVMDTSNATSTDRMRLYVNGDRVTTFSSATYPAQNTDFAVNNTQIHEIGRYVWGQDLYLSAMLADVYLIDGQALTPTSFGETDATTGVWNPKAYTGSYGTNGFHLEFADNSAATATTLGKDTSGNSPANNWTPNNLSVTAGAGNDSLVDSPTNYGTDAGVGGDVRGNYCTWNPLDASTTLANGNLDSSTGATYQHARSTHELKGGKWYAEFTINTNLNGTSTPRFGVIDSIRSLTDSDWTGGVGYGIDLFTSANGTFAGKFSSNGVTVLVTQVVTTFANGDIVGVAYDGTNGNIWFSKNGSWLYSGSPSTGATPVAVLDTARNLFFHVENYSSSSTANFGQRPFAYTAPSGFKALCTQNLPAPVVTKPSTVMDVALWTGNGSARSITGLAFNPDLVWIKGRSGATDHALYDAVRGVQIDLVSNSTAAETTQSTGLTAFNSDGFSIGTLAKLNTNSATYAGWCWDAGSSTVTNTAGSISSQVRANASAGFSVVTWTGAGGSQTVGHGLGVTPAMIIAKNRSTTNSWAVWFTGFTANEYLLLNSTAAKSTFSTQWGSTPTSTVFGVADTSVNGSGNGIVAYCFAPVVGYSNGFSYTGNGSTDGSFVYLGFRPRLILLKCSSTTGNWTLVDTAREGYNVDNDPLHPNLSNAEGTTDLLDITSNGFKLRTTDASVNSNAATYVGFAWAESPFQYSRAR
jgi:hypothetical protein